MRCDHRDQRSFVSRGTLRDEEEDTASLSVMPLTFLLSSCFVLQGFWIVANQIEAGGKATKAIFKIRAGDLTGDTAYQFFLVGVS